MSGKELATPVSETITDGVSVRPRAGNRSAELTTSLARRKLSQAVAFGVFWLAGLLAVAALLWIVGYVLVEGFQVIDVEFLTTRPQGGVSGEGGMSTTIVATLYLVVFTMFLATPIGVGAAIYLTEYAADAARRSKALARLIRLARTGVEILAGVPSIIYGLFGFALFVVAMNTFTGGFSILSASLAGACMVLPVIVRTSEEALLAVPRSYREGSLALGATKWRTITQVVLPAALPGIVTGLILSVGRIVAETAIFWVTIGGSYRLPTGVKSAGRPMALHVYMLATETRAFEKAMGTAAILILTIVILNLVINLTTRYYAKQTMGRTQ
jgi:phosphate transport system permease protein